MTSRRKRIYPGDATKGEIQILRDDNLVFENKFIRVYNDSVRFPSGLEAEFVRLTYLKDVIDGVIVVPVLRGRSEDEEDELILVRQFRHAPRIWMEEFPRGFAKATEGSPSFTLERELFEETPFRAIMAEQKYLGRVVTDSGKLHDIPHVIAVPITSAATGHRRGPERSEAIEEYTHYTFAEIRKKAMQGDICDCFTLAALLRLEPHWKDKKFSYDETYVRDTYLQVTDEF